MRVSWRARTGVWVASMVVGALSTWLIGTTAMASALVAEMVIRSGSIAHLAFLVALVPIVGAVLLPGALVLGAAAGGLARATVDAGSPRARAMGLALLGAVLGAAYAAVLLESVVGLEVQRPGLLVAQAAFAGALSGGALSALVGRHEER